MRKNIIILIITAFSLAIAATFLYFKNYSSTLNSNEAVFKIENNVIVSKIEINKNKQNVFYLKSNKNGWSYCDKFSTDKTLMHFLFQIISTIEVSSLVSENISQTIADSLTKKGHEVIIYDVNENKIKDYFIWANNHNHTTYAIMKNSSQPYIVKIPGYQGNFAGIFALSQEEWYNKSLIDFNPRDIKLISFENLSNRALSFAIDFSNGQIPVLIDAKGQEVKYKKEAMQVYLNFLLKERLDMISFKNNIKQEKALYSIKIKTIQDKERSITFFQQIPTNNTKPNTCLALINDNITASFNSNNLDLIFRDISFFIK
ncbi:MAG TPA: hypothetical protein PK252_11145 [Bacteroidales bacterium]|nr:hypothetical protein [Bacteroidales bacterium]